MKKIFLLVALGALLFGNLPSFTAAASAASSIRGAYKKYSSSGKIRHRQNRNWRARRLRIAKYNRRKAAALMRVAPVNTPLVVETVDSSVQATTEPLIKITENPLTLDAGIFSPARSDEDIQSGNVTVKVSSNGNASVKLGMSPMGVTMIEFPANDPVYEIHHNELYNEFVSVSCRRQDESGRCMDNPTDAIILRPGKNFRLDAAGGSSASTVITVQRISGIVVSFIIVPVNSIAQNANHVVVTYPVEQIVAARTQAGLSVNLAPFTPAPRIAAEKNNLAKNPVGGSPAVSLINASLSDTISDAETPDNSAPADELETQTVRELQRVGNAAFLNRFSKPVHGISLAVAPNNSRLSGRVIDVFAVRNDLNVPVRLVPEMPELFIDTIAEKGKPAVMRKQITPLYISTTANDDDILSPGAIYYFAVAYDAPILGAKQNLRVGFAQTNAADEPAFLELSGIAR